MKLFWKKRAFAIECEPSIGRKFSNRIKGEQPEPKKNQKETNQIFLSPPTLKTFFLPHKTRQYETTIASTSVQKKRNVESFDQV